MKTLFITLTLLCVMTQINAQKFSDAILETREIVLNSADTIKKIKIFIVNPKVKIKENKFYAWYQKQLVLHTQGAWSGKLLQGKYESFYPNHNLLEQGIYEKGWKVGLWKKWYSNGSLKEQIFWKKGLKHGHLELFAPNGQLIEKRTYREGQLHGYLSTFENGEETKVKYRKGKLLVKKPKSSLFSKKEKAADTKIKEKNPKKKKTKVSKKLKVKKQKSKPKKARKEQ